MKRLLLIITSILFFTTLIFPQSKVNKNNLVQYGDKWFKENDDRPFSGIVFDMDKETGNKILEYSMSNGEKNGRYKEWNQEGVLIKDGFYKTELMNGKWKFYYNNGNKLVEGSYLKGDGTNLDPTNIPINGRVGKWDYYYDGEEKKQETIYYEDDKNFSGTRWYENGQKEKEVNYIDSSLYDGLWTFWDEDGKSNLSGNYNKGYRSGKWIYTDNDGRKYSGKTTRESGEPGDFLFIYNDDNSKVERHFVINDKDEYDGLFIEWYQNEQKKEERNYKDGKKDGLHITWNDIGQIKNKTYFLNNMRDGKDTTYYIDDDYILSGVSKNKSGDIHTIIEYKQDKKNGIFLKYHEKKLVLRETYKNDEPNGLYTRWYDNGNKEVEYRSNNSSMDGYYIGWDKNGNITHEGMMCLNGDVWDKTYSKGVVVSKDFDGYCHNGDGKVVKCQDEYLEGWDVTKINIDSTMIVTQGKLHGPQIEWYDNGQKKIETTYIYGEKNGPSTGWYENGQKKEERTWKNGEWDGLQIEWYENGQIEFEGTFIESKRLGLHTWWFEDGKEMYEETYKDGRRVSSKVLPKLSKKGRNIEEILIGKWIPESGDGSFFISLKQNGSMDLYDDGELDEGESGIWFLIENGDELFITGKENDSNSMKIDKIILVNNNQFEIYESRGKQIFNRKK